MRIRRLRPGRPDEYSEVPCSAHGTIDNYKKVFVMTIYQEGLAPAAVNHMALSPLSFIERTAAVYPNYPAVIHGSLRRNWQEPISVAAVWRLRCTVGVFARAIPLPPCCRIFRPCWNATLVYP